MKYILLLFTATCLLASCDLLFNSFSEEKFKGTYKVELREMFESTEELDASSRFLASLAKFAMNDVQLIFNFADNKKGTIEIEGAAIEMLSLLSDEFSKPMDMEYYFKSDSILMVKLAKDDSNAYQKLGVVRAYDKNYSDISLYVADESDPSKGTIVHMRRK